MARNIHILGEHILLRDLLPEDIDSRIRWITTELEWQNWDAPWEGIEIVSSERIEAEKRVHIT